MRKRIISSIIAAPLLVYIVISGGLVLDIAWLLVLAILLFELCRMVTSKFDLMVFVPSILYLITAYSNFYYMLDLADLIVSFYIIIMFIINVLFIRRHTLSKISLAIIGSLYIIHLGIYLFSLADLGTSIIIVSFVAAWGYDTFAYFSGVRFGKRRPWPELSPKKSIEGVIGGAIGSLTITTAFAAFNGWNIAYIILYSAIAIFLAQCGDLIESSIKRYCSVKDSGKILPGHGGLLDRFDSVLPILPLTYLFFIVLKLQ